MLADPITLPCGSKLPNRICKAALTEGLADQRSLPTPSLLALYRRWGRGGAGLLITGNCQVDRRYMERPGNVAIDGGLDDEALRLFREYAAAGKEGGAQVWMQLSHAGRQADKRVSRHVVGPSALPYKDPHPDCPADSTTRALTAAEIDDVVARFAHAAKVCCSCGFDGVQLHSAHGYLLSSFLNPLANIRTDEYGGDLANRARLLLRIIRAVRASTPPTFAVAVKLNSADFQKGGFTVDECCTVATWLEEAGIDLLELSGGSYEKPVMMSHVRQSTQRREGFFLEFTKHIRAVLRTTPLMVTGGFRSAAFMAHCLATGECDVIGLGRPMCMVPDAPARLLAGTIGAVPDYETPVPWYLYPLYWTRLGPALEPYLHLLWFERALLDLAAGLDAPRPHRPVLDALEVHRHDSSQAAALIGIR